MTLSTPSAGHTPGLPALMARLLMPVLDAELRDPELDRIEVRVRRAAKKRAESAWHVAWLRQEMARHLHEAEHCRSLMENEITGRMTFCMTEEEQVLRIAWVDAVDAMMRIPAPHVRALRWKQGHAKLVREWTPEGRAKGPNPRWAALIAADVARLGKEA